MAALSTDSYGLLQATQVSGHSCPCALLPAASGGLALLTQDAAVISADLLQELQSWIADVWFAAD